MDELLAIELSYANAPIKEAREFSVVQKIIRKNVLQMIFLSEMDTKYDNEN